MGRVGQTKCLPGEGLPPLLGVGPSQGGTQHDQVGHFRNPSFLVPGFRMIQPQTNSELVVGIFAHCGRLLLTKPTRELDT